MKSYKRILPLIGVFLFISFFVFLGRYRAEKPIYAIEIQTAEKSYFLPNSQFTCQEKQADFISCTVHGATLNTNIEIYMSDSIQDTNCIESDKMIDNCKINKLFYYARGEKMRSYIEISAEDLTLTAPQQITLSVQSFFVSLFLGMESAWFGLFFALLVSLILYISVHSLKEYQAKRNLKTTLGYFIFLTCVSTFGVISLAIIAFFSGLILD